jgi:hypothetical protein
MSPVERRHLYLPARDRSFWRAETAASPLLYLAWGSRDFHREPVPASRHEGWVCVLVEEGAPFMVIRKRAVRMPSGTLVLIGPDCPFGWRGSASGQSRFRLWMWRTVAASWPAAPLSSTFVSRQLARHERPPFLQLHDLCRREVLRGSDADATYLEGCRLLFDTMIRRAWRDDETRAGETVELVGLARAWMMAHLDSREPVARLCDYLDVSQSRLHGGRGDQPARLVPPRPHGGSPRAPRERRRVGQGGRPRPGLRPRERSEPRLPQILRSPRDRHAHSRAPLDHLVIARAIDYAPLDHLLVGRGVGNGPRTRRGDEWAGGDSFGVRSGTRN